MFWQHLLHVQDISHHPLPTHLRRRAHFRSLLRFCFDTGIDISVRARTRLL